MNAAEWLVELAARARIDCCFANPGTTEMPLVLALERVARIRPVLCLHENVCTGAADAYGRLTGRPALTLLHLGPGFANGIANLHNARRARAPVINLVGEHASWHLSADAPLTMDLDRVVATVSSGQRRIASPGEVAEAFSEVLAVASRQGVATLIFPHDHQLAEIEPPAVTPRIEPVPGRRPEPATVDRAAEWLRGAGPHGLFLGGAALWGEGLRLAGRIARACGADLIAQTGFARLETGRGRPPVRRLPYFPEQAQETLDRYRDILLCGAPAPVSFFGYAHLPSRYLSGHPRVLSLAGPENDAVGALALLAERLDASEDWAGEDEGLPEARGALDVERLASCVARRIPEDAVVVLTPVSSAGPFSALSHRGRPHTQIALTGGAIGEGMALALGAAVARPGSRILHLEADGSAAYLPQALWSQAREGLPITTVICANRAYRILRIELARAGIETPGPLADRLTRLDGPVTDWVSVARGFGVEGCRVDSAEALDAALARALSADGPSLIEAVL